MSGAFSSLIQFRHVVKGRPRRDTQGPVRPAEPILRSTRSPLSKAQSRFLEHPPLVQTKPIGRLAAYSEG